MPKRQERKKFQVLYMYSYSRKKLAEKRDLEYVNFTDESQ
jgi:hypothetical protein